MDFNPTYAGDKYTDGQRNGLSYGAKLRFLGGLASNAVQCLKCNALTQQEQETIHVIVGKAQERAKKVFEDQKSAIDSRTASEHRQYTGK